MMAREISQHVRTREPFGRVGSPSLSPSARCLRVRQSTCSRPWLPTPSAAPGRISAARFFALCPRSVTGIRFFHRRIDLTVYARKRYAPDNRFRKTSEESPGQKGTFVRDLRRAIPNRPATGLTATASSSNECAPTNGQAKNV